MSQKQLWDYFNCSRLELPQIALVEQLQASLILSTRAEFLAQHAKGESSGPAHPGYDPELEAEYDALDAAYQDDETD